VLAGPGATLYAVALLFVSLALIFYGRSVIKALAFLVAGLAGAALGATAGALVLGPIGSLVGVVVGFIVGGMLGLLLVSVGIGVALGYFAYQVVRDLTHVFLLAAAVGVVLFIVGLAASRTFLELAAVLVGGVILYGVLIFFGAGPAVAAVIAIIAALAGFLNQSRNRRQGEHWRQGV
jgi:hypothetical protein